MESREQKIDNLLDLVCDLPPEQRARKLDELELEPDLRARVEQLLAIFDEPRQGLERFVPASTWNEVGGPLERIGAFQIERTLGEGGMGVVFLARRADSDEPIAIKVMRSRFSDEHTRKRFRREAEVLSRLRHPSICRFLETGECHQGGTPLPYLAMEYVEGESLHDDARHRRLDDRQRVELLARVCDALQHAHEQGIIHRDLKPNNILVTASDDRIGLPKVLDFGVAHARGEDLLTLTQTNTGALVGTIAYMSPEQVAGSSKELDARSDVYSLGVLLYELLSGRLPYSLADQPVPVAARIIQEEEPTRLGSVVNRLGGAIEHIVSKALEKEPSRRYESAAAFAEDLRRFVRNEAVSARASTWTYQVRRFARRHRVITAAVVGSVSALAIGLVSTAWFAVGQARARAEADEHAYRTAIRSATIGIQLGESRLARSSLDGIHPEDRGWVWRHLDASADDSSVCWEVDGKWLDMAFDDSGEGIELWNGGVSAKIDIQSGKVVKASTIEFTRQAGARFGAYVSETGSLRVATASGALVSEHELPPHASSVGTAVGDPLAVLVHYSDHSLFLDTASNTRRRFSNEFQWGPNQISPSRNWLVSGIAGGFALWDLSSSSDPFVYDGGNWRTRYLAFSPVRERLACPDRDGRYSVWELSAGSPPELSRWISHHREGVEAVTFSPNGNLIASSARGRLAVSNVDTGDLVFELTGHRDHTPLVQFSPDAVRLASLDQAGELRLWDLQREDPRALSTGSPYLYAVEFDPSGERFYAGTPDGELIAYDARSSRRIARIRLNSPGAPFHVFDLSVDRDGSRIVAGSQTGEVRILSLASGLPIRELELEAGPIAYMSASLSPEGSHLAVASSTGKVWLYDTSTWQEVGCRVFEGEDHRCVRFDPSGKHLVVGSQGGALRLLDPRSLRTRERLTGHARHVRHLSFHDNLLATAGYETARVWNLDTREQVAVHEFNGRGTSLAFSPDGERLLIGDYAGRIQVVHCESWRPFAILERHTDYVYDLAFSPDGETLISTGGDGTVRVWRTRPLREIYREQDAHNAVATGLRPYVEELLEEVPPSAAIARIHERSDLGPREREIALQQVLSSLHHQ